MEKPSAEAARWVWGRELDLVIVDGDHTYEGCTADAALWAPKLRPGGTILFHDYNLNYPDVIACVHDAAAALLPPKSSLRFGPHFTAWFQMPS